MNQTVGKPEQGTDSAAPETVFRVPRPNRMRRVLRIAGASLVVLVIAAAMSLTGLYFLLRGETIENSALNQRIHSEIRQLTGGNFTIDFGRTTFALDPDGLLSLASTDVRILRTTDKQMVSRLGRIVIGIKPWSVIKGSPKVDAVIIEDSIIDGGLLAAAFVGRPVTGMEDTLRATGQQLARVTRQFAQDEFRLFQIRDVHINGMELGRKEPGSIFVSELEFRLENRQALALKAEMRTTHSNIRFDGSYRSQVDGRSTLSARLSGVNLRDWTWPLDEEEGPVASNAVVDAVAEFPFGIDGTPGEPTIKLTSAGGDLRLGREGRTVVRNLALNLRLMPERDQIELDPSTLVAGDFNAQLVGGLRPADADKGFAGPLRFELIADPAKGQPTVLGERTAVAGMKFGGHIMPSEKRINIDEILVVEGRDQILGSASIEFIGETPSIAAAARSRSFPVYAAKQLWPFWLAPKARNWAFRNVVGGTLTDLSLAAAIRPGKIGRFRQGAKMLPEEFELSVNFGDVRLDTFGEMPAIRDASGTFAMNGMTITANLDGGTTYDTAGAPVDVTKGSFVVSDFAVRPAPAYIGISLEGTALSLSLISEQKPISVFTRLKLDPAKVTGKANADVVAKFPLKKGLEPGEVDWNAIIDLQDVGSTERVFDRTIADADVVVEVDGSVARINGEATVDGARTKIAMVEPIGNSGVERQRDFTATLDDDAREKMGLSLDAVIDGPVTVRMLSGNGDGDRQTIDLENAELSLPWIGWKKGKGIAGTATFTMREKGGVTSLDDFFIEGPGFSAAGVLKLDKQGLLSADFANVSLNEGDVFSVAVKRDGKTYNVTVEGQRMDARGLINKLFHEEGVGDEQGETNLNLTANLGSVRGFNGRIIRNVSMRYGTTGGWFDNLSLRGAFSGTDYVSVVASTVEGRTTFQIESNNAGSAFALVDVYRRMEGGDLTARLVREGGGPFTGPVNAKNFEIVNEPRLASLVGNPTEGSDRGEGYRQFEQQLRSVDTNRVRFLEASATIDKGKEYFRVKDAALTAVQMGLTFDGLLFDDSDRMDLTGTFLPALGITRAINIIPLVGGIFGNGRDSGLLGITFRLHGQSRNPSLEVNPVSAVAPGQFRKVFEFRQ